MPNSPIAPRRASVARFPHERLSDAELVRAIGQGDQAAVGVIWDRYSAHVRAVLRSSLGMDSDVEDLLQEVFLAFLRGVGRLRSADSLRAYLVGIAVRLVMVELRRRRVRRWVMLSVDGDVPESPVAAHDAASAEVLRALYRLLEPMPPRRRLAFVLRHIQGFEVKQAAELLQVSESTLKREARRARAAILTRAERREPALWDYLQGSEFIEHE